MTPRSSAFGADVCRILVAKQRGGGRITRRKQSVCNKQMKLAECSWDLILLESSSCKRSSVKRQSEMSTNIGQRLVKLRRTKTAMLPGVKKIHDVVNVNIDCITQDQAGVVYLFWFNSVAQAMLSVGCVCVCSDDNSLTKWHLKEIFGKVVHFDSRWIKFTDQGQSSGSQKEEVEKVFLFLSESKSEIGKATPVSAVEKTSWSETVYK